MKIAHTQVIDRTPTSSDVIVCGDDDDGKQFAVVTTIREGRAAPDGWTVHETRPLDDRFLLRLHEALDEQTTVTAEEMDRICGA